MTPTGQFVQHHAQREYVAGRLGGLAARLLGRHVTQRPAKLAVHTGLHGRCAGRRSRRASPKSSIFTKPSGRTMTFSGLMSRCTMPRACVAASAWPICEPHSTMLFHRLRTSTVPAQRMAFHQFHGNGDLGCHAGPRREC